MYYIIIFDQLMLLFSYFETIFCNFLFHSLCWSFIFNFYVLNSFPENASETLLIQKSFILYWTIHLKNNIFLLHIFLAQLFYFFKLSHYYRFLDKTKQAPVCSFSLYISFINKCYWISKVISIRQEIFISSC